VEPQSGKLVITHQWTRPGQVAIPVGLELSDRALGLEQALAAGRSLVFSNVRELPPKFKSDIQTLEAYAPNQTSAFLCGSAESLWARWGSPP
jgi:hypothetical protein